MMDEAKALLSILWKVLLLGTLVGYFGVGIGFGIRLAIATFGG